MSTAIRFQWMDDKEGDYFVSVDGASEVHLGRGDVGRTQALSFLKFMGLKELLKKQWIEALELLRLKCKTEAMVEANCYQDECTFNASIDDRCFEGLDENTLDLVANRIEATLTDHQSGNGRAPGK